MGKIKEMGAEMYKGIKKCDNSVNSSTLSDLDKGGGANPTLSLQNKNG